MPITCTYGDLDKLRDLPGRQGPLGKLMNATEPPSIVDKFRIARFVKSIDEALVEYGKMIVALGKKYGEPSKQNGVDTYKIRPENLDEFNAEKAKVDADVVVLATLNPLPVTTYSLVPLTAGDLSALEKFVVLPDGA